MALSICARRLALSNSCIFNIHKRYANGYIILLPEAGDPANIRSTTEFGFPYLTYDECAAKIAEQSTEFEERVKYYGDKAKNCTDLDLFDSVLTPIERGLVSLEATWNSSRVIAVGNPSVLPMPLYNKIQDRAGSAAASRFIQIPIYEACKKLWNKENVKLTDEQRRLLRRFIIEGKFHGLDLTGRKRNSFKFTWNTAFHKRAEYNVRVSESIRMLSPTVPNYDSVRDLPYYILRYIAEDPEKPHEGPWVIKLEDYIVKSFLEYCSDASLRSKVWKLYVTRASLFQERLLQNSSALEELRGKRLEKARHLGYESYIDITLETKMAENLNTIYNTFDILAEAARPVQEQEIQELTTYAATRGLMSKSLEECDVSFYARKYKAEKYQLCDNDVRPYLPLPNVLDGLFALTENLFNVKIQKRDNSDVWHPDVEFFDVFDTERSTTTPIGGFYFDPYYRTEKRYRKIAPTIDDGLFLPIRNRSAAAGTAPLSALIFYFPPPSTKAPTLLSMDAAANLFHQFGRMLQHTLTLVQSSELAGINFIDRDASLVSNYFMENWIYEPTVLKQIANHYETGEPMPSDMMNTALKQRSYLAGYKICKELYLAHMDLEMHAGEEFWMSIAKRLWKKYLVTPQYEYDSHVCSWRAVFTESPGAVYYCNLWSRMVAADLFSAFQDISLDKMDEVKKLAGTYRNTFLALGGTYPAVEVFRRFRGRDPSPQPLLKSLGLLDTESKIKKRAERSS